MHREFDGVAEDVDQDLLKPSLINPHDAWEFTDRFVTEAQALVAGLQLEHADNLLQELREVQRLDFQCQFAAFDSGDIERAFDHRQ